MRAFDAIGFRQEDPLSSPPGAGPPLFARGADPKPSSVVRDH